VGKALKEDLSFCWQQVLSHDPWFRLHYLFAPSQHAEAILALHALAALLEETLDSSEEALTITRLQWWRSELEPENAQVSAHPVLRTLRASRGGQTFPLSVSEPLVAQVLLRLQGEPLQDEDALKLLCNRLGQATIAAQLGLGNLEDSDQCASWRCAGAGLASLVEFAIRSKQKSWWFVPLDLQARYQFDMNDMPGKCAGNQGVIRTVSKYLDDWFEEQITDIALSKSENAGIKRHLVAMSGARKLRFKRTIQVFLSGDSGNPGRWKVSDLFRVWSLSRRA